MEKYWRLETTEQMTLWCKYDSFYNVTGYAMTFAVGGEKHGAIVQVTQDNLIVELADTYDTQSLEREIIDFEIQEAAHAKNKRDLDDDYRASQMGKLNDYKKGV